MRLDDSNRVGQELNLLFTKIEIGELDDAYEELLRLIRHPQARTYTAHLSADVGALAYATGDFAIGREYYQRAIQIAKGKSEPTTEALARAYFARAANQSGDPNAENIKSEMLAAVEKLPSPGALYIMRGLATGDQRLAIEQLAAKRVATRKWAWDQVTNTLTIF
jgi:tetratricopeptide (TPR) repeat protein